MDWYVVRERTLPHGSVSACAIVEESIIHVRFSVRVRNAFNRVHCRCVASLSKEMRAKLHHIPEYTTSPGFTLHDFFVDLYVAGPDDTIEARYPDFVDIGSF